VTVCVALCCSDGVVVASDSLTTFGRGAPVARYTNKVYVVEHADLANPVVVAGAGASTFIDKFIDRAKREAIEATAKELKRKLDVVDFVERVCEPVVCILMKEYWIDRAKFFGGPQSDFSLAMLVAGCTLNAKGVPNDLRAYTIYSDGLSEIVDGYGTIGSGAAYAELFLHGFAPEPHKVLTKEGVNLLSYAIKGVEIMDTNVGGDTSVCVLKVANDKLSVTRLSASALPPNSKDTMEKVLKRIGTDMRRIVK
jgi:20S proteasome alpha/beta subunit